MKTINEFKGEYAFLSNFYPSLIRFPHFEIPTVEHLYQASKTRDIDEATKIIRAETPGLAKKLGGKVILREDWEEIKDSVMLEALRLKFAIPELKQKLLDTGNAYLIEGNWWGDKYWGVCRGAGQNKLGKLLMQVREEIKNVK